MKYPAKEISRTTTEGNQICKHVKNIIKFLFAIALLPLSLASNAQTLGTYPNTTVVSGQNATVTPSIAPTGVTSAVAYTNTNFTGLLTVNPTTGVVSVTNPKQAGIYPVTIKAFGTDVTSATFTLTVTIPECSKGSFYSASNVNAGGHNTNYVTVGDFNNDGKQDIAACDRIQNIVSIRLGNGSGGFTGTTEFGVGTRPYCIAIGDFNGDGNQDLAIANDGSNSVSIRMGNGTGGFSGSTEIGVGTRPVSVVVGDFNGDGRQDIIAVNNGSSTVSVRLGDGTGSFTGTTEVSIGEYLNGIAIGDFNSDGKEDIAVTYGNFILKFIAIRLGDGTGNFSGATNVYIGDISSSVAIGDFNGDGKQDFAASNTSNNSVSIRLGDGSGGFSGNTQIGVGTNPRCVAVNDFNGDGKQDIATVNYGSNNISIRLGNGAGGFSGNISISAGAYPVGLAIGDFNGDGKQDIASCNNQNSTIPIRLGGASEINVSGNSNTIFDGDYNPSSSDFTDFGDVNNGSTFTRTFTIQNKGTTSLSISGISSSNPLFEIVSTPTPIAAGSSANFNVTFTPTISGVQNSTITIFNNDCDEAEYDYSVMGKGIGIEIFTWYKDADNDGYSDGIIIEQANQPLGYKLAADLVATTGDCNDADASINPSKTEVCGNGKDDDCNPATSDVCTQPDADGDGVPDASDCAPNDNTKYRTANLYLDKDNDGYDAGQENVCYGATIPTGYKTTTLGTDCDDANNAITGVRTWYKDSDDDGYSDGTTLIQCFQPEDYKLAANLVALSGDCNETNGSIHPGAPEICDGIDNDCDGVADAGTDVTWYKDADNDGYSDGTTLVQCFKPANYKQAADLTATSGDCNDGNAAVNPAATEVCDGIDNNCNSQTDEGCPVGTAWYFDYDKDGYGNPAKKVIAVDQPNKYVANPNDCRDYDAAFNPGATELCDGLDNNCNGQVDEGCPALRTWYYDKDKDGYGNANLAYAKQSAVQPAGYVDNATDCRDYDANTYPGAAELCDGIDNDCDGTKDEACTIITQPLAKTDAGLVTELIVFPNPASTEILVTLSGFEPGKKLEINLVQADGKPVLAQSVTPMMQSQQVRIDVRRLSTGYYLLQVKQGVLQQTKKVMIVR